MFCRGGLCGSSSRPVAPPASPPTPAPAAASAAPLSVSSAAGGAGAGGPPPVAEPPASASSAAHPLSDAAIANMPYAKYLAAKPKQNSGAYADKNAFELAHDEWLQTGLKIPEDEERKYRAVMWRRFQVNHPRPKDPLPLNRVSSGVSPPQQHYIRLMSAEDEAEAEARMAAVLANGRARDQFEKERGKFPSGGRRSKKARRRSKKARRTKKNRSA
jgi:hypothetical protein